MKRELKGIFGPILDKYELFNHIATLGLDYFWRRKAGRIASREGGTLWLDICTGTGEMAQILRKNASPHTWVLGLDFSKDMIMEAKRRRGGAFDFLVLGDAGELPFKDETFELVTTAFATRNLEESKKGLLSTLKEFHRVLRPGGRLIILETSQPDLMLLKKIFHLFVKITVMPLGTILTGSRQSYSYLSYSIRHFLTAPELKRTLREAGFKRVEVYPLFFGAAAIHKAFK